MNFKKSGNTGKYGKQIMGMTKRKNKSDGKDKCEKVEGDRCVKLLYSIWEQKVIFITKFKYE